MNHLLRNWNIGNVHAFEPIPSYWGKTSLVITSDGKNFILKEKQNLSQAKQEFYLLSSLSNARDPVALPVGTINDNYYILDEGRIYCLYPKLPGKIIENHYGRNAIARARSFGKAIAFLHSCFLKCDYISDIQELKLIEQVQEWAIPCIRKSGNVINCCTVEETWNGFEPLMI